MILNDELLNGLSTKAGNSPRLRMNMDLRNSVEDKSQRMLNVLLPGTIVPIHRHCTTSETTMIVHGRLFLVFFDETGAQIERYLLDPTVGNYGVQIPKGQWHSVEVIEPSAIVEFKDGPFMPLAPEDMMN